MKRHLAILFAALLVAPPAGAVGLISVLTPQQQALLGCGPFFTTSCGPTDGFNVFPPFLVPLNQDPFHPGAGTPSPGVPDVSIDVIRTEVSVLLQDWLIPDGPPVPVGTRPPLYIPQPGTRPLTHPLNGQLFASELAALSWNAMMSFVAVSFVGDDQVAIDSFDPGAPFRPEGCSFARPQSCFAVQEFLASAPGAAVPEPGAALLFGLGAAAVASATRRRS